MDAIFPVPQWMGALGRLTLFLVLGSILSFMPGELENGSQGSPREGVVFAEGFSLLGRNSRRMAAQEAATPKGRAASQGGSEEGAVQVLAEGQDLRRDGANDNAPSRFYRSGAASDKKENTAPSKDVRGIRRSQDNGSVSECQFKTNEKLEDGSTEFPRFYIPSTDKSIYEKGMQDMIGQIKQQLETEKSKAKPAVPPSPPAAAVGGSSAEELSLPAIWLECQELKPEELVPVRCHVCLYNESSDDRSHVRTGQVVDTPLTDCMKGSFGKGAARMGGRASFHPICYPPTKKGDGNTDKSSKKEAGAGRTKVLRQSMAATEEGSGGLQLHRYLMEPLADYVVEYEAPFMGQDDSGAPRAVFVEDGELWEGNPTVGIPQIYEEAAQSAEDGEEERNFGAGQSDGYEDSFEALAPVYLEQDAQYIVDPSEEQPMPLYFRASPNLFGHDYYGDESRTEEEGHESPDLFYKGDLEVPRELQDPQNGAEGTVEGLEELWMDAQETANPAILWNRQPQSDDTFVGDLLEGNPNRYQSALEESQVDQDSQSFVPYYMEASEEKEGEPLF